MEKFEKIKIRIFIANLKENAFFHTKIGIGIEDIFRTIFFN